MGKRANVQRANKVAMWEAYQRDVVALGADVHGARARAAAGGRHVGKDYEETVSGGYEKSMQEIREGSAYQSTYDDYIQASRGKYTSHKAGGYYERDAAPRVTDRRDPDFEKWAMKEYGSIEGFKIGSNPRRSASSRKQTSERRKAAMYSTDKTSNFTGFDVNYSGGLY